MIAMLVLNIHCIVVLLYTYAQATFGHEMCGLGTRLVHTLFYLNELVTYLAKHFQFSYTDTKAM